MRIVILSRHYPEYCFRYATALARHAEVLLVLDRRSVEKEFDAQAKPIPPNITVEYANLRPRRSLFGFLAALRRVAAFKPDLIHFQELPEPITPLMMVLLYPFSRLVLTVHDPSPHSGLDSARGRWAFRFMEFGRRLSDLLIVHGQFCENTLLASQPKYGKKTIRSRHGVLMASDRPAEGIGGPALFFGRMHKYKGLEVLLAASDILHQRQVPHRIVVAGSGPEADRLLPVMKANPSIEPHNYFIDSQTAITLFRNCSFVIMPYLDATQSGVAAAAIGNSKPVIASRVGGLPDLIADGVNGLLVEPGNAQRLADALETLLTNQPTLVKLAGGAHRSAQNELNWDTITDDLFASFSSFLGKRVA